jgi:hypothetical protein
MHQILSAVQKSPDGNNKARVFHHRSNMMYQLL